MRGRVYFHVLWVPALCSTGVCLGRHLHWQTAWAHSAKCRLVASLQSLFGRVLMQMGEWRIVWYHIIPVVAFCQDALSGCAWKQLWISCGAVSL